MANWKALAKGFAEGGVVGAKQEAAKAADEAAADASVDEPQPQADEAADAAMDEPQPEISVSSPAIDGPSAGQEAVTTGPPPDHAQEEAVGRRANEDLPTQQPQMDLSQCCDCSWRPFHPPPSADQQDAAPWQLSSAMSVLCRSLRRLSGSD